MNSKKKEDIPSEKINLKCKTMLKNKQIRNRCDFCYAVQYTISIRLRYFMRNHCNKR